MEESLKRAEGHVPVPGGDKQRYWGSVRFFKHMILLAVAAFIFIPTTLSVVIFCKYKNLEKEYVSLKKEYDEYFQAGYQGGQEGMEEGRQREEEDAMVQDEAAYFEDNGTVVQILGVETSYIPFTVDFNSWNYLLINEKHPLPQDYEPVLAATRNGKEVDQRIKYDLEKMLDAAEENGLKLIICSAYRDYEKQDELIDESIAKSIHKGMSYESAFFEAKKQLGRLGCSEHHTGLAVDLVGESYQSLDSGQAKTKEAQWLEAHACEYGFILRYPEDKEDITGIDFESWHYRYVGRDAAMYMKENNLCLEEFLELAAEQQAEICDMEMDFQTQQYADTPKTW